MKLTKKYISYKPMYLFMFPLLLFLFGAFFSLFQIFTQDAHITVLPYENKNNASLILPGESLLDGSVIKGNFVAYENNLGTIALKIKNLHGENVSDNFKVYFRIKESNTNHLVGENTYNGGQFHELDLFPFGFMKIPDSKGKRYSFEIYSKGATKNNALTIARNQTIVTEYQFTKTQLKIPKVFLQFMYMKFIYALQNFDIIFSSLIYFLPFYTYYYILSERRTITFNAKFTYFIFLHFLDSYLTSISRLLNWLMNKLYVIHLVDEEKIIKKVHLLTVILFITILIEVFLVSSTSNFLLLIIITLWGITIFTYDNYDAQISYLFALFFLVLCFILLTMHLDAFADKSAIWAYLFLIIGTFQLVFSLRADRKQSAVS